MKVTYRAMQITTPGTLELVERETPKPGAGEVLIEVEACGICGADAADIERADPSLRPPRVPGHEVVGRIIAIGENAPSIWQLGQRVGVGRLGGHCNECVQCRHGQFQLCENQPFVGASRDGGYAEMMLARGTGLVSIPEELNSEEAAPILCAGILMRSRSLAQRPAIWWRSWGLAAWATWRCNMPAGWASKSRPSGVVSRLLRIA
jgi:alcohol dehydrogenase